MMPQNLKGNSLELACHAQWKGELFCHKLKDKNTGHNALGKCPWGNII